MPWRPIPILVALLLLPHARGDEPLPPGAVHRFGPFRGTPVFAFSPSGKTIVIADESGRVELHEVTSRKLLKTLRANGPSVRAIEFSPDGSSLAIAATGAVRLLDPADGRELHSLSVNATAIVFVDGKQRAARDVDGVLHMFDASGREQWHVTVGRELDRLALTPDRKTIVAEGPAPSGRAGPLLLFFDALTGQSKGSAFPNGRIEPPTMTDFAVSPDGRRIASAHSKHELFIWDTVDKEFERTLQTPHAGIGLTLSFSPDGKWLAGAGDGGLRVWELATGAEVWFRDDRDQPLLSVAFAPDTSVIATATEGSVLLWSPRPEPWPFVHTVPPENCFVDLSGRDSNWAYRAVLVLADRPAVAVPLIRKQLPPRTEAAIAQRMAELGHPKFEVRDAATRELVKHGRSLVPAYATALVDEKSPEVRRRLRWLIDRAGGTTETWDVIRGRSIQVLELCGTPEAVALLREYADAPATSFMAAGAKAALARLAARK